MKKNVLFMGLLALGLGLSTTSCSDDDDDDPTPQEYYQQNAEAWGTYVVQVSSYIEEDAANLFYRWDRIYADQFKKHEKASGYNTAFKCVNQMLQGCVDLAKTIGSKKLDATESIYAKRSTTDYQYNIQSIASVLIGVRMPANIASIGSIPSSLPAENSLYSICTNSSDDVLSNSMMSAWKTLGAISAAINTNNEGDDLKLECDNLVKYIERLQQFAAEDLTDEQCEAIVAQFVDQVVLPTYKDLKNYSNELNSRAATLKSSPSNASFTAVASIWTTTHMYWELTEAFAFGPAKELKTANSIDYNPVSEASIKGLIKSKNWQQLKSSNSIRGFHTLEYLLYADGAVRTVK